MRFFIALILICTALLSGCTPAPQQTPKANAKFNRSYPIQAVVTVGMVADLLREIGGEHVVVNAVARFRRRPASLQTDSR